MAPMKAVPTAATAPIQDTMDHAEFLALKGFVQGSPAAFENEMMENAPSSILPAALVEEQEEKDWRDPHSMPSELDTKTSEAIIQRLESRGKDPIFRSLFDTYFPFLLQECSRVLEIGAGTGVIGRSLAARGFKGKILGVDQSPVFVEAAKNFAAQEGYGPERLDFKVCAPWGFHPWISSREDLGGFEPDAIIMHTLLSHVEDPAQALRTARALARPGAVLILVDGDYLGLHYHSTQDPDLAERMSRALVEATFASPGVVRALPKLLGGTGWRLESASGKCVSEFGAEFSYWKSFAEAYMPRVKGSGRVAPDLVETWWADQKTQVEKEEFLAACTYYTLFAKAVDTSDAPSAKL